MNHPFAYPYRLSIAGINIDISFHFQDTASYFGSYCLGPSAATDCISVGQPEWDFWTRARNPVDPFGEYSLSTTAVSDALLAHNRCIIHAVAFQRAGKAWLIAAAPGIGKSTQIETLQNLYPGEFSIISGDRPVLEQLEGGGFMVHPSPWNGKENWYGAEAAPLAGILCLQRGETTSLRQLSSKEAIFPVYTALIGSRETEDLIQKTAAFETALLNAVPAYEYVNGGVPDSSRYLYDTLLSKEVSTNEI